ncbi:MAG: hypothetical protein ACTHLZ_18705 [Tepidisphaeraceae bacterium]
MTGADRIIDGLGRCREVLAFLAVPVDDDDTGIILKESPLRPVELDNARHGFNGGGHCRMNRRGRTDSHAGGGGDGGDGFAEFTH